MKRPEHRHDHEIKARFTPGDYLQFARAADQRGIALAEFVRECALERLRQIEASRGQGLIGRAA